MFNRVVWLSFFSLIESFIFEGHEQEIKLLPWIYLVSNSKCDFTSQHN